MFSPDGDLFAVEQRPAHAERQHRTHQHDFETRQALPGELHHQRHQAEEEGRQQDLAGSLDHAGLKLLFAVVAMHRLRRKGGQADGDVLRAFFAGSAVTHPLAGVGQNGLAGFHFEHSLLRLHPQLAFEHHRKLVELGGLAGFEPASRARHLGDGNFAVARIHRADEFADDLRLGTDGFDDRGFGVERGHRFLLIL